MLFGAFSHFDFLASQVNKMGKFGKATSTATRLKSRADATQNKEGGLAFKMDAKTELYTRASTAMIREPKFYDKNGEGDDEMIKLIGEVAKADGEFALKLASYCRNELYLRSVPMVLLVEACKYPESKKFVRKYTPDIIQRADELTQVIAYWTETNGHIGNKAPKGMLCNSLKRGIADTFGKFDEYQLAKYDRDGAVKLKDVLAIVHPKPKDDVQKELWNRVLDRKLAIPRTWETVISGKGSTKENWESVLPDMGFMARLRNIRNCLDKGVDVKPIIKMLEDKDEVKKSKQFPYRFFSAYREIEEHDAPNVTKVMDALETALELSIENVPEFKGRTFITTDNSGSMQSSVSGKSKIKNAEIGNLLGAMANKLCEDAIVSVFATRFKVANISPNNGIISNCEKLCQIDVDHSTDAWQTINYLLEKKIKVDRILIFSDMQCYDSENRNVYAWQDEDERSLAEMMEKYRHTINPDAYLYSFDLSGYGTAQFPQDSPKTCLIAGWSDKVLSFIPQFEQGKTVLETIDTITAGKYTKKKKGDVKPEQEE